MIRKRVYWLTDGNIVYDWDEIFDCYSARTDTSIGRKIKFIFYFWKDHTTTTTTTSTKIKKTKTNIFLFFCFLFKQKNVSLFRRWCLSSFHRAEENRTKFRLSLLFNFFFFAVWRILWNSQVVQLIFCFVGNTC